MSELSYRADIDGLRAIAVLSVVIYHAMPEVLPGGFTGVDIFFVISGFLITGILAANANSSAFSLLHFYERRIRRIFPALFVVVMVVLAAGYVLLLPGDYRDLGRSATWAMGFLANVFFWLNTGYFDATRETMPLLHTWSLAVEEQFYLFWPIVILIVWRCTRFRGPLMWLTLIGLMVSSFAACVLLTDSDPQAAFYLPLTRAWELLAGGLLFFLLPGFSSSRNSAILAILAPCVGLALIVYAFAFISSELPFPGYNALYPVVGSALLLLAGALGPGPIQRLLSTPPMVFVGKISYSLYLWHWPVFVFFRHYSMGEAPSSAEAIALIALSVALATASWKWVEQPFRYARATRTTVFAGGAIAISAVLISGLAVTASQGFPSRIPDAARQLADNKTMWSWPCPSKRQFDGISSRRCVIGKNWDSAERHAVLWGDSHSLHYAPLVDRVANRSGYSVLLYDSCPPYLDNKNILRERAKMASYSEDCGREHAELIEFLRSDEKIDLVMLASAWALYPKRIHGPDGHRSETTGLTLMREGMLQVVANIEPERRSIFVFTEVPRPGRDLIPCVLQEIRGVLRRPCDLDPRVLELQEVQAVHGPANQVLHDVAAQVPQMSIVDSTAKLCGKDGCETFINGEFIYRDTNHLRRNLSPETMDQIIRTIRLADVMAVGTNADWQEKAGS